MNNTQWLFELESLYHREETRYEEISAFSKIIKQGVATMLGLNLMPMEDKIGVDANGDDIIRYRRPNEDEYLPFSLMVGREDVISEILNRQQELANQTDIEQMEEMGTAQHMTPEELEDFMHDDGDIVFEDPEEMRKHRIWNSETTKRATDSLVLPMDAKDEEFFNDVSDRAKDVGKKINTKSKVYTDED